MSDLDKLRAEVAVGWKVRITDHDHSSESRDDVTVTEVTADGLTLTPKRPWSSQESKFATMSFRWDSGDRVVDDLRVDSYTTPAPHTGKSRRRIKTFVFEPPRG